jgi:hypothetical protein
MNNIVFVQKDLIAPAFGRARGKKAFVRVDLSPRVKKFVIAHELYHLSDNAKWGGWIGREIRANLVCGIKDPFGFLATVIASLNHERLNFYLKRLRTRS